MISSNDLRPGITVELDGMVWQCVEFQHVKPGKGAAFVRAKLKICRQDLLLNVNLMPASNCRMLR